MATAGRARLRRALSVADRRRLRACNYVIRAERVMQGTWQVCGGVFTSVLWRNNDVCLSNAGN